MIGFFRRGKKGKEKKNLEAADDETPYIDMLSSRVKDSSGNHFGEVVSADENSIVMKSKGKFYSIPTTSVNNRFGDLMLAENIDMTEALRKGEEWRNPGTEVIGENTFYDFSEKIQAQQEKEDRILGELRKTRKLARKERDSILLEAFPDPGLDIAASDITPEVDVEESMGEETEDVPEGNDDEEIGDDEDNENRGGEEAGEEENNGEQVMSDVVGSEETVEIGEDVDDEEDGDVCDEEGEEVVESEEETDDRDEGGVGGEEDGVIAGDDIGDEEKELTGEDVDEGGEDVVESEEETDDKDKEVVSGEEEEEEEEGVIAGDEIDKEEVVMPEEVQNPEHEPLL